MCPCYFITFSFQLLFGAIKYGFRGMGLIGAKVWEDGKGKVRTELANCCGWKGWFMLPWLLLEVSTLLRESDIPVHLSGNTHAQDSVSDANQVLEYIHRVSYDSIVHAWMATNRIHPLLEHGLKLGLERLQVYLCTQAIWKASSY